MTLRFRRLAAIAAALTLSASGLCPVASGAETGRGNAYYFGVTVDPETLYSDPALLAMGFDETDIAYLERGEDVTYIIQYDKQAPMTYEELPADSPERAKTERYFGGAIEPEDSLMTNYYAVRIRGDEKEALEDVTNVTGRVKLGLLEEQGDVFDFVENGSFTMLYLAGEEAQKVAISVTPEASGHVVIDFAYQDSGQYIVLYEALEHTETTTETTATTTEATTSTTTTTATASSSAKTGTTASRAGSPASAQPAPKTGDAESGICTAALCAALLAVVTGRKNGR